MTQIEIDNLRKNFTSYITIVSNYHCDDDFIFFNSDESYSDSYYSDSNYSDNW